MQELKYLSLLKKLHEIRDSVAYQVHIEERTEAFLLRLTGE